MSTFRGSDFTAAHLIESEPFLVLDELRQRLRLTSSGEQTYPDLRYFRFIANRQRGETRLAAGGATAFSIHLGGVKLRGRTIDASGPRRVRDGKVAVVDPEWTEGATLAIVGLSPIGSITREVHVPRFGPLD